MSTSYEEYKWSRGLLVAGVDEAGRGPLAGPVVAAAYVLRDPKLPPLPLVQDSKVMTADDRDAAFSELVQQAPHSAEFAIAIADQGIIDSINILQATYAAMTAAVQALPQWAQRSALAVAVDGNRLPPALATATDGGPAGGSKRPRDALAAAQAVVKGDSKVYSIAAASVLAKVARDRLMQAYDAMYPQYGLGQHKGYPTAAHMAAVMEHGPSPIHRLTFAPLRGNFTSQDVKGTVPPLPLAHLAEEGALQRVVVVPAGTAAQSAPSKQRRRRKA